MVVVEEPPGPLTWRAAALPQRSSAAAAILRCALRPPLPYPGVIAPRPPARPPAWGGHGGQRPRWRRGQAARGRRARPGHGAARAAHGRRGGREAAGGAVQGARVSAGRLGSLLLQNKAADALNA